MSFPKRNLNEGETIALDMHPHWWYFAEPAFSVLGAIALGIYSLTMDHGRPTTVVKFACIVLLIATGLWLLKRATEWATTNFVITSQRIVFRQGIIAKQGMEIPLDRLNNVNFNQGIFERLLGAGDLLIESGGEDGQQRFTDIKDPEAVQNLLHSEMEKLRNRKGGFAPPTVGTSVPEQLERLEGLLQRGSITREEFESQKQRLLG
jgi:uncharacterized membrane protein YdbT with pleckstrin-like domain